MKTSLTTKKAENVMLLQSMICLFSNMGNDLFLSAESKNEEISNSKTSLIIVSKTKTIKTNLTTKKTETIIYLFPYMGNDLFLNAESNKKEISNSKQVLVIVSKTKTIKTSLTTKKKAENIYDDSRTRNCSLRSAFNSLYLLRDGVGNCSLPLDSSFLPHLQFGSYLLHSSPPITPSFLEIPNTPHYSNQKQKQKTENKNSKSKIESVCLYNTSACLMGSGRF